ncbi:MAG TPA: AMP-binding protein [Croceibacterium sp.]|nr:AMP-binding protein [Croceibacterium sp.]
MADLTTARLREMVTGRLRQLQQGERLAPGRLAERQGRALAELAAHAARFSPQFAARLGQARLSPAALGDLAALAALPPLGRRELQAGEGVYARAIPEPHMPTSWIETTGSTGQPVRVMHTLVTQVEWQALTLLEHAWHRSDFSRPLASVRSNIARIQRLPDWGSAVRLVAASGPSVLLPGTLPMAEIAALIRQLDPGQLVIYPTLLATLCDHIERSGEAPFRLQRVRTIGEMLQPERRTRATALLGAPVVDLYSSREFGHIAIECPDSGLYHVPESLVVEVLDPHGRPCAEGEEGDVVVTGLRNYATPLIRYMIRDRAVRGGPCPCGRGLPTLRRIMGRERNMVLMPGGTRAYPPLATGAFWQYGPIVQFQFIQHAVDDIEVRLAVTRTATTDEEQALAGAIRTMLGHPFPLRFSYFADALPPAPGGKREEFVCLC